MKGLILHFKKIKDWRLKEPTLKVEWNYVKVTNDHTPIASPEETIIEFLEHNPQIKNSQARALTGIKSENKMKRIFYKLRDEWHIFLVMSKNINTIIAWTKVK